ITRGAPPPARAGDVARERPILLVEDDADIVAALCVLLEEEGFAVVTARDVRGAIAAIEEARPCLVLLDWTLDDGSGKEVLDAVASGATSAPPVVLLTGAAPAASEIAGAAAMLQKPFD